VLELLDPSHINAEYIVGSFATSDERVNLPLEFFATSCELPPWQLMVRAGMVLIKAGIRINWESDVF
jgi:hypothetical protein